MASVIRRAAGRGVLELAEGDITTLEVDAIVNAANSALQLGGGVAGAIRTKGGPSIQKECDRIGHCPLGEAAITGGGDLPARHVIHAVGPVWGRQSEGESDRLLASACRAALRRAEEAGVESVALPSISTGIFGYPMDRAARVLLRAAAAHLEEAPLPRWVLFCLFGKEAFEVYREALDDVFPD